MPRLAVSGCTLETDALPIKSRVRERLQRLSYVNTAVVEKPQGSPFCITLDMSPVSVRVVEAELGVTVVSEMASLDKVSRDLSDALGYKVKVTGGESSVLPDTYRLAYTVTSDDSIRHCSTLEALDAAGLRPLCVVEAADGTALSLELIGRETINKISDISAVTKPTLVRSTIAQKAASRVLTTLEELEIPVRSAAITSLWSDSKSAS